MAKTRVLFLCTQNSARSQMAETLLREHGGDRFEVHSAGYRVDDQAHPYAVQAMEEIGIDISEQYPKALRTYMGKMHFGYLIIVCARAEQDCPTSFPGVGYQFSWLFDDPRSPEVPEEERLEKFREVRDQIEANILDWLECPEDEIKKLKAERDREREERMSAPRGEAEEPAASPTSFKRV